MNRTHLAMAALFLAIACGGSEESTSPRTAASIEVDRDTITTYPGFSALLPTAAVYDASHTQLPERVTWTSANAALAKINGGDSVQALAEGTVDLIASAGGVSTRVHVYIVREPVTSIQISPMQGELDGYDSVQMNAWAFGPAIDLLPGRVVTLRALDPTIVTVSATGMAHLHASGVGRVEASSEGVADTATILADARTVARITFTPDSVNTLFPEDECDGCTVPWTYARMFDAQGTELYDRKQYSQSSDTTVVRITKFGAAQLAGVGTATVTVFSDSASASYVVVSTARP